jgi:hypothetical protein
MLLIIKLQSKVIALTLIFQIIPQILQLLWTVMVVLFYFPVVEEAEAELTLVETFLIHLEAEEGVEVPQL